MKKFTKTLVVSILLVSIIAVSLLCFTACDEVTEGYLVKETVKIKLFPLKTTVNINNAPLPIGVIFKDTSYIEFTPEGTATIKLYLADVSELEDLLSGFEVDFSTITKISLEENIIEPNVKVMFPGFDIHEFEKSLHLVFASLGGTVEGFDFENNELLKRIDANLKDDSIPTLLPPDFQLSELAGLPNDISITLNAPYCLVDNVGLCYDEEAKEYYENQFTALLFGAHDPDSTPMFTMSYFPADAEYNTPALVTYINYMLGLTLTFRN